MRLKEKFLPKQTDKEPPAVTSLSTEIYSDNNYETYTAISNDPLVDQVPDSEKHEAVSQAFELYLATKANVAPVITGFADDVLKNADGRQIIFAARDGLGAYEAAKLLLERFAPQYDAHEDDLVFAYLTRRLVHGTDPATLAKYLEQEGIRDLNKPVVIADIGMYGTIMYGLQEILPHAEARYIISRNPSIPGYADNGGSRRMDSFAGIMGNPAVHFMEDTFSGVTSSPSELENHNGTLVPNFTEDAFEPKELLKRKYAIAAIVDYAATVDHIPTEGEQHEAVATLDEFLLDKEQYAHLMVPHIR